MACTHHPVATHLAITAPMSFDEFDEDPEQLEAALEQMESHLDAMLMGQARPGHPYHAFGLIGTALWKKY